MTRIFPPRPRPSTLDRLGREFAYRRLGESQAEFILMASRPIRWENRCPIAHTPLEAAEGHFHPVIQGAAGFASYDQLITALSTGFAQHLMFAKASVTTVGQNPYSYWAAGGFPAAGTFGTALTGRTRDDTVVGAMGYTNPGGARTMHLVSFGIGSTIALGTVILYDRLCEYPFSGATTGAQNFNAGSGVQIPSRDANGSNAGDGVLPFLENIQATTVATGPTLTVTYTNQAGTGSQSTGAVSLTGAAPVNRVVYNSTTGQFPWYTLAAGDTGVRNITAYNLSATLTSTQLNLVLARPLAFLPMLSTNDFIERDLVLQLPSLPRIYNDTAFHFLLFANTTTCAMHGRFVIAEN